ncbi:class II aldolase/adducin family protein [Caldimonas tepidiphila]|uniref:class II aldolase/adducin family protein n=1 Tax=Caldimonas tepidiphila TaxID=2315841 RepID=UPI000E5ACB96|nr:class II aldolase/adducin family protein [Caldimonas tepidiphila]
MEQADWDRVLEARRRNTRERVSPEEWAARVELAACYRLCVHYRMTDMIYNHISLRVPGRHDQFLINAFGLMYSEVSASNLVKVDIDGHPVDEGDLEANPAGFVIHAAVHKARPDVDCVFHTHTRAGVAVSAQREGLLPISQHAMRFYNRIGYHDYEGIALDLDEQQRLVRDLGPHKALILRNHGLLTAGATVREAFEEMYFLELSCQIQLDATASGAALVLPPHEVCEHTARQFAGSNNYIRNRDWHALLRMLDRQDPSYKE